MSSCFRHFLVKPGRHTEAFQIKRVGVRRWDETGLVYDVRGAGGYFLRHYSFFDRWFHVNVTLDRTGALVSEAGPGDFADFAWAFNADIATPARSVATDIWAVDLFLDVLVAPNGRDFRVKDEAEFARAVAAGVVSEAEAQSARNGLADLIALCETVGLVDFLNAVCPFGTFASETAGASERRVYPITEAETRADVFNAL